jgi:hypothetical protein
MALSIRDGRADSRADGLAVALTYLNSPASPSMPISLTLDCDVIEIASLRSQ